MAIPELDLIDRETYRKIKAKDREELSQYLQAIYMEGYTQGQADMIEQALEGAAESQE